jgi:hypothetical protein
LNKEKKITIIICFSIYALIILLIITKWPTQIGTEIGFAGFLLGLVYFFISLFLMIPEQTRGVAKAVLLSAGIIFLIGLGVCSQFH